MASFFLLASLGFLFLSLARANYGPGYCPQASQIVLETVKQHYKADPTSPSTLVRLLFHDCFVNGCDGSILLESTPTDGTNVEKLAPPNLNSIRGFNVIEDAKARLEECCPGTISCADTVAMAARDASHLLGGVYYDVRLGRYDGRVSSMQLASTSLPSPIDDAATLVDNFKRAGLSAEDMVVLSGGHTIGTTKCGFFAHRLYNFSNTGKPDPSINPQYLAQLRRICSRNDSPVNPGPEVTLDKDSEFSFDNSYYNNLVRGNGLLKSDQTLAQSSRTARLVEALARNPDDFQEKFAAAMIKMGNIGWKTSANGEIRRVCSRVN